MSYYCNTMDRIPGYINQDILERIRTTVTNNVSITGKAENQAEPCFLESLNIKWKKPSLNTGIKARKKLTLFS